MSLDGLLYDVINHKLDVLDSLHGTSRGDDSEICNLGNSTPSRVIDVTSYSDCGATLLLGVVDAIDYVF